jgi:decaprenyl-phosphate phosphoribosyltransferase
MVVSLLKASRPHQWIKNLFVAAPLVFARRIDDSTATVRSLIAVACFCLLSSAVYLLNDIVDIDRDRAHPLKRMRPIASGRLSVGAARIAAFLFAVVAIATASVMSPEMGAVATAYIFLNVAYSFWLKRIPFVDVGCIAVGFILRVLGGSFAIPVPASRWLLGCTGLLACLLGFGKRAHELRTTSGEKRATQRLVLDRYPPGVLRALIITLSVLTTLAYGAYTQSSHAQVFVGRGLAFTIPFVAFGILRFVRLTNAKADSESPTESMLKDKLFLLNLAAYAGAIILIIYFK